MINKKLKLFLIIIVVSILVCLYLIYSINPWKATTSKASLLSEVPKKYRIMDFRAMPQSNAYNFLAFCEFQINFS